MFSGQVHTLSVHTFTHSLSTRSPHACQRHVKYFMCNPAPRSQINPVCIVHVVSRNVRLDLEIYAIPALSHISPQCSSLLEETYIFFLFSKDHHVHEHFFSQTDIKQKTCQSFAHISR
jgi:hypothetical protein